MIELLVTIAIVAILAALATPSLRELYESNRVAGEVNAVISDLQLARSEAIKQGREVFVCISKTGKACDNTGSRWDVGWLIFIDENPDGKYGNGDVFLRHRTAWTGGDTLTYTTSAAPGPGVAPPDTHTIIFTRDGFARLGGGSGHLQFTSKSGAAPAMRCITIKLTGKMATLPQACS